MVNRALQIAFAGAYGVKIAMAPYADGFFSHRSWYYRPQRALCAL